MYSEIQFKKVRSVFKLIFYSSLFFVSSSYGQGIPRSTGLGTRAGFWRPKDPTTGLDVGYHASSAISGAGEGKMLYFFSRLKDNWFLETSFGKDGGTSFVITGSDGSYEGDSHITPILFGCRYDWLSPKYRSIFQPYVSGGTGLYWITKDLISSDVHPTRIFNESDLKPGMYVGSGLHIVLKSWFAINFDMKYHFVNFMPAKEYSGLEFGGGFCFMWGRRREIFRIEEIKVIVEDIYPAYYQFYNTYPLALVSIENTAGYSIEVNVRSEIKGYSERTQESGFLRIDRGETKDIPVKVLFGPKLLQTSRREPAVIDLEVEARAGTEQTKSLSRHVMIHHRNGWDGEIGMLGFFVTPDDEPIMEISRGITHQISDSVDSAVPSFVAAKHLFDELNRLEIRYQRDPNIPFYKDDRVQFASETIDLKAGDCDDLVVLYASLLESVGIKTAFVDVKDPEKEIAHVYLLIDAGVSPEQSHRMSHNEKRFVIRETRFGKPVLWIPVETTLVEEGFESAWRAGAKQYLEEGILRNGIAEGWVKIIDVE